VPKYSCTDQLIKMSSEHILHNTEIEQ